MVRRFVISVLAAAVFAAASALAQAAETVSISVDTSKGYARMVFGWPKPVTAEANIADGILIITFARPFQFAPGVMNVPLDEYVSVIKQDPSMKTLRLSLNGKFRVHTSAAGPLYAIDLLPLAMAGDPADIVDPNAAPTGPKPPVDVRMKIAVKEDRTRLSFEWGENVNYKVAVADGTLKVNFEREGKIDVARLNDVPPAFVKSATSSAGDDETLLEIKTDPDSRIDHFRDKTSIVFDVMAPGNDKDAEPQVLVPEEMLPPAPAAKPKEIAEAKPEPAHDEDHGDAEPTGEPALRPGSDGAAVAAAAEDEGHGEEATPTPSPTPAQETPAEEDHAAAEPAHEEPAKEDGAHAEPTPEAEAEDPQAEPAHEETAADTHAEPEHAEKAADTHVDPTHDDKPAESHGEPAHDSETAHAEAPPAEAPPFKSVRVRDEITLTLPATSAAPAAMFRRGDRIVIAVKGAGAIDTTALLKGNKELILAADLSERDGITILSIRTARPLSVTAGSKSGAWTATISADPLEPPSPVALLRDARTVGPAKVRATLERAGAVVDLTDPQSGEPLFVVLASGDPQAVIGARTYVDFAADATAQGIVIRPFIDDLSVTLGEHDVVIAAPAGLTLSAGTVSDYAPDREAVGDERRPAAMDFKAWAGAADFLTERSRLISMIGANKGGVEGGRLALARFYLAYDLGPEALGVLQMVVAEDEAITSDPSFRALRAASLIQMQRYLDAEADLASTSLADDPAAQLWRGLAAAGLEKWGQARDFIEQGEPALADFRSDWQARFRLAGAHGAIETNAVDIADRLLNGLPKDGIAKPLLIEGDLLRAMLAERLKRDGEALRLYAEVRDSGYRPLAVRAALAEISLKARTGAMKAPEAIAALDKLRWQWRGDGVELNLLHRLGNLQIEHGDYRNGLQTLRAAVLGFPRADEARRIQNEMAVVFEDLFLRGKADNLPPIQALGLYYDFKELTPIGTMGDEMVRRLSDRLIAVDLLEQAAELLQHQVDRRLDGVAKAQISAKLAAVYLMDRKPEKALATLRASTQTRLPEDLAAQRRLLTARALTDLKQYDAALEAFEQDETPEAVRLRADVYWAASRWAEAAAAIEPLIQDREKDSAPLDGQDRYDILRAAIAYTMADDSIGLKSLRDRFVTLMADTPEAAAFEVVTRAADPGAVAFRDMAKAIAGVDTLDAFLRSLGLGRPAPGTASN